MTVHCLGAVVEAESFALIVQVVMAYYMRMMDLPGLCDY
jgi:hypothetical protein